MRLGDRLELRIQRVCEIELTGQPMQLRDGVECGGERPGIAAAPRDGERLFRIAPGRGQLAFAQRRDAQLVQREPHLCLVVELARELEHLCQPLASRRVVAHADVELPRIEQAATTREVALLRARPLERLDRDAPTKSQQTPVDPVVAHGRHESQPQCSAVGQVIGRRMRGEQVLPFDIEPCQPHALLGAEQLRPRPLRKCQVVREMTCLDRRPFARCVQPFARVLSQRVEQAVASIAIVDDQRFLGQSRK